MKQSVKILSVDQPRSNNNNKDVTSWKRWFWFISRNPVPSQCIGNIKQTLLLIGFKGEVSILTYFLSTKIRSYFVQHRNIWLMNSNEEASNCSKVEVGGLDRDVEVFLDIYVSKSISSIWNKVCKSLWIGKMIKYLHLIVSLARQTTLHLCCSWASPGSWGSSAPGQGQAQTLLDMFVPLACRQL